MLSNSIYKNQSKQSESWKWYLTSSEDDERVKMEAVINRILYMQSKGHTNFVEVNILLYFGIKNQLIMSCPLSGWASKANQRIMNHLVNHHCFVHWIRISAIFVRFNYYIIWFFSSSLIFVFNLILQFGKIIIVRNEHQFKLQYIYNRKFTASSTRIACW